MDDRAAVEAAVLGKWVEDDKSGCWNWTGTKHATGYGRVYLGSRVNTDCLAHRLTYELFVGPIPDGLHIDHLCQNRACVNPSHMEPVTPGENVLRGNNPPAQNRRKTHCLRGHELWGSNLFLTKRGRGCRQCHKLRVAAYLSRKRFR